jgi:uncharacterized protein (TIGR02598 family)
MKTFKSGSSGFSLVEVALAMGVAAFCLVSLLGMLTVGLTSSQVSSNETRATHLMSQVADDLQVAQVLNNGAAPTKTSPFYGFTLPANGSSSTMTSSPQTLYLTADGTATSQINSTMGPGAVFRVTVGFSAPAATNAVSQGSSARIQVTWPAQADPAPNSWPSKYVGSVETVLVLDKN